MKAALSLPLAALLFAGTAGLALAQNVSDNQRQNIVDAYADYAKAYRGFDEAQANNDHPGQARKAMNDARDKVLKRCGRAGAPDWFNCVLEFIPANMRTPQDIAIGLPNTPDVRPLPGKANPPANNGNGNGNSNRNGNGNGQIVIGLGTDGLLDNGAVEPSPGLASETINPGGSRSVVTITTEKPNEAPAPADASARVRAAANTYIDAVTALNQALGSGQNPRRFANRAGTAQADLKSACQAAGLPDVQSCTTRLGLSVPAMPDLGAAPVRENLDNEDAAALLDSQKDADNQGGRRTPNSVVSIDSAPIGLPRTDRDAQADLDNRPVESANRERGTRTGRQPQNQPPSGAHVVQNSGDRTIVQLNNQFVVRNNDEDSRLAQGAAQTYYEDLSRGRVRETIVRPSGMKLVTIRNANGDILQRSRFDPQGNETVLAYVAPENEGQLQTFRDPGADLPPLQLNIPANQYVMDADQADTRSVVTFLDQPPVEHLQRYYSIDEVTRSARLRDMVRRLEIGNLTFDFGSANLAPDQVNSLYGLGQALLILLDRNPGEVFLIEGHTDAVGSDYSNLLLSDRRAENVARILSQAYGIPPENLVTQGYGERYLKVLTPYAERANRRVTVKRITPLIAPVPAG